MAQTAHFEVCNQRRVKAEINVREKSPIESADFAPPLRGYL